MSDKQFDDFIKHSLSEYASQVPAGMWERIREKRESEKSGVVWWRQNITLLIAILVLLSAGGWIAYQGIMATPDAAQIKPNGNRNTEAAMAKETTDPHAEGSVANMQRQALQASPNANAEKREEYRQQDAKPSTLSFPVRPVRAEEKQDEQVLSVNETELQKNITTVEEKVLVAGEFNYESSGRRKINAGEFHAVKRSAITNAPQTLSASPSALILTDCPSGALGEWFIEVFASPDYALKTVQSLDDEFVRRKDSAERFRSAFTAGFRLSKIIRDGLVLKTGLQYSQINERFDYRSESERRTVTVITVRTIVRGAGDTIRVTDTSTIQQLGYRVKTTYNRYRSLDIPLLASFEWGNANLQTSFTTGVIINLHSWQQGDVLDTSYTPISMGKNNEVFRSNIGIGLYASFSLLKPVGNRTTLFAEPYLRYNISSMTNSNRPFNQRFHAAGINLGLRYKLSGNGPQ